MRVSLTALSTLLFSSIAFGTVSTAHADPLKVKTNQGKVEGALTADGQVRAFKGIPYAAPPVGNLRWQAPQPAAHFHGTFAAKDFGPHCTQSSSYPDMIFHDSGASEDCLTLNIWAPVDAKKGSLPVMIWIYGGGFTSGGTSEARQDGQFLAHRNVIVVSMNYRLGIFGFMALPQLTAESPHHASGNYGLLDQAAAIAWIKQNIRSFGGDPANLTIFGESAGSFSVSSQMASPLTRTLISKAIGESGGAFSSESLGYPALAKAEQADSSFASAALGTDDLAALRRLSTDQILTAATSTSNHHPRFGPDIDGYFLPKSVGEIYAAGEQAHIPLLAGWNSDEGRAAVVMAKIKPTAASFAAEAEARYGANAPAFLAAYAASTDAEAAQSAGDLAGDRFIALSTWLWIEAQVKTGGEPVFRYFFDLGSPGDRFHPASLGAFHSDDIEYVFGTLDSRNIAAWRPEDRKLSVQIQQYWTNFARTGNPNGATPNPELPQWPGYHAPDWELMHLDATSAASPDIHRARYEFLSTHPAKPLDR
jgi:para-nitrobenzyl esterase